MALALPRGARDALGAPGNSAGHAGHGTHPRGSEEASSSSGRLAETVESLETSAFRFGGLGGGGKNRENKDPKVKASGVAVSASFFAFHHCILSFHFLRPSLVFISCSLGSGFLLWSPYSFFLRGVLFVLSGFVSFFVFCLALVPVYLI